MAKRPEIQYIRLYTDGSAAKKVLPEMPSVNTARLPKARKVKIKRIYIDPVATLGIVVAVCMLVLMAVGVAQCYRAQQEAYIMESYIAQLRAENTVLQKQYSDGYDLEAVEKAALSLGLVPKDSVEKISIEIPAPQLQLTEQESIWGKIGTFLTKLFA